jgi:hypothetical protein
MLGKLHPHLLGYNATKSGENQPIFLRNTISTFSVKEYGRQEISMMQVKQIMFENARSYMG